MALPWEWALAAAGSRSSCPTYRSDRNLELGDGGVGRGRQGLRALRDAMSHLRNPVILRAGEVGCCGGEGSECGRQREGRSHGSRG